MYAIVNHGIVSAFLQAGREYTELQLCIKSYKSLTVLMGAGGAQLSEMLSYRDATQ